MDAAVDVAPLSVSTHHVGAGDGTSEIVGAGDGHVGAGDVPPERDEGQKVTDSLTAAPVAGRGAVRPCQGQLAEQRDVQVVIGASGKPSCSCLRPLGERTTGRVIGLAVGDPAQPLPEIGNALQHFAGAGRGVGCQRQLGEERRGNVDTQEGRGMPRQRRRRGSVFGRAALFFGLCLINYFLPWPLGGAVARPRRPPGGGLLVSDTKTLCTVA